MNLIRDFVLYFGCTCETCGTHKYSVWCSCELQTSAGSINSFENIATGIVKPVGVVTTQYRADAWVRNPAGGVNTAAVIWKPAGVLIVTRKPADG